MPRLIKGHAGLPDDTGGAVEVAPRLDLEDIYLRHSAAVSRWAERLAGPGFDVEDIVQDVFIVVQRRLPEFRGDAKITTWLYEITIRVVQERRRSARWRRLLPFGGRNADGDDEMTALPDLRPSPLEDLERRQSNDLLYRLLDRLDDKYRTAVILFELDGMSCQQIADVTGVSLANVWARVSRGRDKLMREFAQWEALERNRKKETA